jgi:C-terminal processing protease CtpA/Prc
MRRTGTALLLASLIAGGAVAQDCASQRLTAAMLGFENKAPNGVPGGWYGFPPGTVSADAGEKHGGARSLRFERNASSDGDFSSVLRSMPIPSEGKAIELRGWLRAEGGVPKLWMRQDGESPNLAFVNMKDDVPVGTEWTRFSIGFDRRPNATSLFFGVSFVGSGKGWADDLELSVDGKLVPGTEPGSESPLQRDHEFDEGSRFALTNPSDSTVDGLVLTGKVWGFLKYHHPAVTAGRRHWDFDLLRKLPVLATARPRELRRHLVEWIDSLGPVEAREPVPMSSDLQLPPDLAWLDDAKLLGKELRARLQTIYRARVPGQQAFVCLAPGVGNVLLGDEPAYSAVKFPDSGFQILTIYRFWNLVEYWAPYRGLIDENWDEVLRDSLRRAAAPMDATAFQREILALVARADDGHANLWSAHAVREPIGACRLPLSLRHLEGRFVVKSVNAEDTAHLFAPGDVLVSLDGVPVDEIAKRARRYYGASNESALLFQIARGLTRGACGPVRVELMRESPRTVDAQRIEFDDAKNAAETRNDRPGDTFQMLSPEVGYLKLSSIKSAEIPRFIEQARTAKSLVVDIRNYPFEYVVYSLGALLVDARTPFVTFTMPDLSNPGAFHWAATPFLEPAQPHFSGRVAVLVDETSMSQAEYTAMALQASPRAIVVGSQTAGADGNVTPISLPGNLRAAMSGIGVFYPDHRPTQRVGVKLDVECPNTVAGLREGRDETLDCALRELAKSP